MTLPRWLHPSSLTFRIYAVGLLQFLVVAGAMKVVHLASSRVVPFGSKQATYVAEDVARAWSDEAAVQREVARAARTLDWDIVVTDEAGRVVAHASTPSRGEGQPLARASVPIHLERGPAGRLAYDVVPPGPPPGMRQPATFATVPLVVGVASFLVARWLAHPLAALAETARAFGRGKLDARSRSSRADEVGEVARAFDDMADRVASLLRAERELLANVSHELRTPMARIRVALDLASEGEQVTGEAVREIAEDLGELERLVDDVLAAARLSLADGGGGARPTLPVRDELVDIEPLLGKATARFRSSHPRRTLELDVRGPLPSVQGDSVLVRRVVDNLLENAHKYTEDVGAPVWLRARGERDAVVIEVEDRGVGIAPGDRARVFEPFFRADRSRARATGGLGLGLTLVRRVVDAHGGELALESELGRGTTVRVRLPAGTRAPVTP